MIRHTTKLAFEFLVGLLAILVVAAGIGYWQLSRGPISLGFLRAPLQGAINSGLNNMSVQLRDIVLEQDQNAGGVRVRLRDVVLLDATNGVIARSPRAAFSVKWSALLLGRIEPTGFSLIGPRLLIKRQKDGAFQLGFGTGAELGPVVPAQGNSPQGTLNSVLETVTGVLAPPDEGSADALGLNDISIRNAQIEFRDTANDAVWLAPQANLIFQRVSGGKGVSLLAEARIRSGESGDWGLQFSANYDRVNENTVVSARVTRLVPAGIARKVPILSNLAQVRLPLSGEANFKIDRQNRIVAASAVLSAAAGVVALPGFLSEPILIDEGAIRVRLDPGSGEVIIDNSLILVAGTRTSLKGRFSPDRNADGDIETVRILLDARALQDRGDESAPHNAAIDALVFDGIADIPDRRLDVQSLFLSAGDARVLLSGYLRDEEKAPAIRLEGRLSNIPVGLVVSLWPPAAAPGAREWFVRNVSKGVVRKGQLKVDITSNALAKALAGGALPNNQLRVEFDVDGVETRYLGDLPAIQGANGSGLVEGNRFVMSLARGFIRPAKAKALTISKGRFAVENLGRKGPLGRLTFNVSGPTASVLRALDYEPLGYMKKFGLDVSAVGGRSNTDYTITVPLLKEVKLEQVTLNAKARLSKVRVDNIFGDTGINGGNLLLDVTKAGLTGRGNVRLNGVPAKFAWREEFEGAAEYSSRFELSGTFDDAQRQRLGIDISSFVSGPVQASVVARGRGPEIAYADVKADLTRAVLRFDPVDWSKAAGRRARSVFRVEFLEDGVNAFRKFSVTGKDISVAGDFTLNGDGTMHKVSFGRLNLDLNRMVLTGARRDNGVLAIRLAASVLDTRPMIRSLFKRAGASGPPADTAPAGRERISINATVNRALAHQNVSIRNISASLRLIGNDVEAMTMTGSFTNGRPIEISLAGNGRGGRALGVRSADAGEVLRGMNIYAKVRGGDLTLASSLGGAGQPDGSGVLRIKSFRVEGENTLRRVRRETVAANPEETGLPKRQADDGSTFFSSLRVPYTIKNNVARVDGAYVRGPSIGATAQGTFDTVSERLDFGGSFIPAYALNSLISNVPILGAVLTGGKGEGIFGVNFTVSGTISRPRFSVNPVSALMPGIFRKLFQTGGAADPARKTAEDDNSR